MPGSHHADSSLTLCLSTMFLAGFKALLTSNFMLHCSLQAPANINPLKTLDSDVSDEEEGEAANGSGSANGKSKKEKAAKQAVTAL